MKRADIYASLQRSYVIDYAAPRQILAPFDGPVTLRVAEGDSVDKDQLLARFDTATLDRQTAASHDRRRVIALRLEVLEGPMQAARLDRAVAAARTARDQARALAEKGELAEKRLAQSRQALQQAEDARATAHQQDVIDRLTRKIQLAELRRDLSDADREIAALAERHDAAEIRAPFAGRVIQLAPVDAAGKGQARQGRPLVLLTDPAALGARLHLTGDEADGLRGATARILTVDPAMERDAARVAGFDASIDRIARREVAGAWQKEKFELLASFADPEGHWHPGDTARCAFRTLAAPQALVVPPAALTRDDAGPMVTRLRDGTTRRVPVQLGLSGDGLVQVLSGLRPGDEVLW